MESIKRYLSGALALVGAILTISSANQSSGLDEDSNSPNPSSSHILSEQNSMPPREKIIVEDEVQKKERELLAFDQTENPLKRLYLEDNQAPSIRDIGLTPTLDVEDSESSSHFIQNILNTMTGQTAEVKPESLIIDSPFQLTEVGIYVSDLKSDIEILFVSSIEGDSSSDLYQNFSPGSTYYTRKILEADQQIIAAQFALPRLIVPSANGNPSFTTESLVSLHFQLKKDEYARQLNLRSPEGKINFSSFVPDKENQEIYPISFGEVIQEKDVSIVGRINERGALTFEVETKERDSLLRYTYVLVYEPMTLRAAPRYQ